jgi:two-component system, NarL family, sensor histidine kinase DegS
VANDPAAGAAPVSFERLQSQATDSIRRDARRVHELTDRFRQQYRRRLEEWMQLRARLDRRGTTLRPVGTDALRTEYELLGRELASHQARLKRLDVAARQLELLAGYAAETDPHAEEPTLADDDESPAAVGLRIVQAEEAERQRLAEDVHDGPAQVLTNAIFQVEYLDRVLGPAQADLRAEVVFLRDMLRDGLDEVRSFIADLRPPVVDVGLGDAIAERGAQLQRRDGIAVHVHVGAIDARLTPSAKASALRIVQEALQNVRKHAAASEVRIGLEGDALVIADNGRGFDLVRLASGASRNFGLQFMRERAELMGGQLHIESRQGEGTRILLRLPERGAANGARPTR